VFQDGLKSEAAKSGIEYKILSLRYEGAKEEEQLQSLNFGDNFGCIARCIELLDGQNFTFFVYEGEISMMKCIGDLAKKYPKGKFVLNLMRADMPFATPGGKKYSKELSKFNLESYVQNLRNFLVDAPSNLKLFAESQHRALLVKALGDSTIETFPTYSQLSGKKSPRDLFEKDNHEVLLGRAVSFRNRKDMIFLLALIWRCRNLIRLEKLTFKVTFNQDFVKTIFSKIYKFVTTQNLVSVEKNIEADEYFDLFASASAIILVETELYLTQSSGKAQDALVTGAIVLATAGTYGDREMNRWIGGSPTFRNVRELAQLLSLGPWLLPHLRKELIRRNAEIQTAYGASKALSVLL
jgi:hypothetical protein